MGVSNVTVQNTAVTSRIGDPGVAQQVQTGQRSGETVKLSSSPQSLAADMQEEIGQAFSQRQEKKAAKKRSLQSARGRLDERINQAKGVDNYLSKLPELKSRKEDVEKLIAQSKAREFGSQKELLGFIKEEMGKGHDSPDPVQIYAVLEELSKSLGDGSNPKLAALVDETANAYLAENSRAIHSGLIISESAALYASEALGSMVDLRNLYMDEVAADSGIGHTFCSILEKHGAEGFSTAVDYLIRAAGADMASMTSDVDKNQQKAIIDNLYQLEVVKTTHEVAEESLRRIETFYEGTPGDATLKLMQGLFQAVDKPFNATPMHMSDLAESIVAMPIDGKIAVLREMRTVLSNLPLRTYSHDTPEAIRNKDRIMDNVIQAQTDADDQEQEMLANE